MHSELYSSQYFEDGVGSNYGSYGDDPGWLPTALLLATLMAPSKCRLLEVACAKGFFVRAARFVGFDAAGCDISEYAISAAPESVKPFVTVSNAVSLPYSDNEFSMVCSWEFMEHVPENQLPVVFSEMERVLEPNGWLVHRIGFDSNDSTHVTIHPREWWEELFIQRGWIHLPDKEQLFDETFSGRDWAGRFFVFKAPTT